MNMLEQVTRSIGVARHEGAISYDERDQMVAWVTCMARRDWAVQVLDANSRIRWQCVDYCGPNAADPAKRYRCEVGTQAAYEGPTPDAARLASAEAVWPTLPEEVRQKIGPKP